MMRVTAEGGTPVQVTQYWLQRVDIRVGPVAVLPARLAIIFCTCTLLRALVAITTRSASPPLTAK